MAYTSANSESSLVDGLQNNAASSATYCRELLYIRMPIENREIPITDTSQFEPIQKLGNYANDKCDFYASYYHTKCGNKALCHASETPILEIYNGILSSYCKKNKGPISSQDRLIIYGNFCQISDTYLNNEEPESFLCLPKITDYVPPSRLVKYSECKLEKHYDIIRLYHIDRRGGDNRTKTIYISEFKCGEVIQCYECNPDRFQLCN